MRAASDRSESGTEIETESRRGLKEKASSLLSRSRKSGSFSFLLLSSKQQSVEISSDCRHDIGALTHYRNSRELAMAGPSQPPSGQQQHPAAADALALPAAARSAPLVLSPALAALVVGGGRGGGGSIGNGGGRREAPSTSSSSAAAAAAFSNAADGSLALLRYDFVPTTVDTEAPGRLTLDPEERERRSREALPRGGGGVKRVTTAAATTVPFPSRAAWSLRGGSEKTPLRPLQEQRGAAGRAAAAEQHRRALGQQQQQNQLSLPLRPRLLLLASSSKAIAAAEMTADELVDCVAVFDETKVSGRCTPWGRRSGCGWSRGRLRLRWLFLPALPLRPLWLRERRK